MSENIIDEIKCDIHGWLVFTCSLIITISRSSLLFSFGIILVKLKEEYNISVTELTWIGVGAMVLADTFSFLPALCIRRIGRNGHRICALFGTIINGISFFATSFVGNNVRWLFLTHTLLYGLGSSFVFMASSLILTKTFPRGHKRHVLITTSIYTGFSVSSLIYNPLVNYLVETFNWRYTYRILGSSMVLIGIPFSWAFYQKKDVDFTELKNSNDSESSSDENQSVMETSLQGDDDENTKLKKELKNSKELKSPCFLFRSRPEISMWCLGCFLLPAGYYMPFFIFPHYMNTLRFTPSDISLAMTLFSLFELILCIIASIPGDFLAGKLIYVLTLSVSWIAILNFSWPFLDFNFWIIIILCVVYGSVNGLSCVYFYACCGEATDIDIDIAWPITNVFVGIGTFIAPLFSSAVYDYTQSYNKMFFFLSAVSLLNAICFGIIPLIKYRRSQNTSK